MRVPSSWLYERASSASVRDALALGHVSSEHLPALVSSEKTDKDAVLGLEAERKDLVAAPASDVRGATAALRVYEWTMRRISSAGARP
jgi:hypothetical protein